MQTAAALFLIALVAVAGRPDARPDARPATQWLTAHPDAAPAVRQAVAAALPKCNGLDAEALRPLLEKLIADADPAVRRSVITAVIVGRIKPLAPALADSLHRGGRPTPERLVLLEALRVLAEPSAMGVLAVELGDFHNPPKVRAACLRAIAATDPERGDGFAAALVDDPAPTLRDAAVRVLGRTADGAGRLGRRLLSGKLPADARDAVIDVLSAHAEKDAEAAELLRRLRGR